VRERNGGSLLLVARQRTQAILRQKQLKNVKVDLSQYSPGTFDRGAGKIREALWLVVSLVLFRLCPFSLSAIKTAALRFFGAKVGKNVTIKPQVKITFPWKLSIGDHVWLGEECWLLNLERITIGNHVCISQRAFLCTGNHNHKSQRFDLMVSPIILEEGSWIGAGAWVGPGVTAFTHSILSAGSVATRDLLPYGIYQGNPAVVRKQRQVG
jgi:putative colanic acid biosynthesis acetyltransferase WcaF